MNIVGVLVCTEMSDLVVHLKGKSMIGDGGDGSFHISVAKHRLAWPSTLVVGVPLIRLGFDIKRVGI